MITLKTTVKRKVRPISGQEEYVYMEIGPTSYQYSKYEVSIRYYYFEEIERLDEEGNPITIQQKKYLSSIKPVIFTREQADGIELNLGITGNNHSDRFDDLITKGAFYHLSVNPTYELDHTGWIVVT